MRIIVGEKCYNLKELEVVLGTSYQTLRKLTKEGKLKATKAGSKYIVTETSLREFLGLAPLPPVAEEK